MHVFPEIIDHSSGESFTVLLGSIGLNNKQGTTAEMNRPITTEKIHDYNFVRIYIFTKKKQHRIGANSTSTLFRSIRLSIKRSGATQPTNTSKIGSVYSSRCP